MRGRAEEPLEGLAEIQVLSDPIRSRIYTYLLRHGTTAKGKLAEELGIKPSLLKYHADILLESGLVGERSYGKKRYLYVLREIKIEERVLEPPMFELPELSPENIDRVVRELKTQVFTRRLPKEVAERHLAKVRAFYRLMMRAKQT